MIEQTSSKAPQAAESTVADAAAWRRWLAGQSPQQAGVWLVLAKKGTTEPTA